MIIRPELTKDDGQLIAVSFEMRIYLEQGYILVGLHH